MTSNSTSKATPPVILAAVEGGGTTFVLTIATLHPPSSSHNPSSRECIPHTRFQILHQSTIPSSSQSPDQTLASAASFFRQHAHDNHYRYAGLGIATFGPVGVDPSHPRYGCICASSPKKEWRNVDVLRPLLSACGHPPHRLDTDVNAPAMAEFQFHQKKQQQNLTSLAYITVGTGIGVGLIVNNLPVHGMMHPEAGHVPIRPLEDDDTSTDTPPFDGYSWGKDACPFGGRYTVEGMACSVALTEHLFLRKHPTDDVPADAAARDALQDLPDDHILWDHAANALANLCVTLILVNSVEKIVLGGGIMKRGSCLYQNIRDRTQILLNGYLCHLEAVSTREGLERFITPSVWSEDGGGGVGPGLVGALVLAQRAVEEDTLEEENVTGGVGDDDDDCSSERYPFQFWKGTIVGAVATVVASSLVMLAVTRNRTR